MRKKWKAVVCAVGCCGSILMTSNAQEMNRSEVVSIQEGEVEPYYTNIVQATVTTKLIGGTATSSVDISAHNQQKITVKLRLEKYKNGYWTTVNMWSTSKVNTRNLSFAKKCNVSKGYTYRTVAVINCGGEQVTKYSNVVSY